VRCVSAGCDAQCMAAITFTATDAKRLLNLPSTDAVETLIQQKVLAIHGYTRAGRPLFTAEAIQSAAAHVLLERR
jgi:hypothetical protein